MASKVKDDYQIISESQAQKIKFSHKWVIHDFNYTFALENLKVVKSGPFKIPGNLAIGNICLMKTYPPRDEYEDQYYDDDDTQRDLRQYLPWISLFINITSGLTALAVGVEAYAINSNGQRTNNRRDSHSNDFSRTIDFHLSPFISQDEVSAWRTAEVDTITIFCDFTLITDFDTMIDEHHRKVSSLEDSLVNDLKAILNDPEYSDVTITVGKRVFYAHKLILSTRSSVFRAMFDNKMAEKKKNNIDITDISEEVVGELLNFIYSDASDKAGDMTMDLLDAAEKYDVKNLKILCAENLHKNLVVRNAVEKLILADRYRAKGAKEYILKFISSNKKEIMKTKEYGNMKETHPYLVIEAFEALQFG